MKLADFLKVSRENAGYTVEEVAQALNLPPKEVLRWETGKRVPQGGHIVKLQWLYGIHLVGPKKGEPLTFPLKTNEPLPHNPELRLLWWKWADFVTIYTDYLAELEEPPAITPIRYRIHQGEGEVHGTYKHLPTTLVQGANINPKNPLSHYDPEVIEQVARWAKADLISIGQGRKILRMDYSTFLYDVVGI